MFPIVSLAVCTWLMRLILLQLLWVITKGIDLPAPPANVKLSDITCTSAMVSWDESVDIIEYNVEWAELMDDQETKGFQNITSQHNFLLENLKSSNDSIINNYTVKVSAIRNGVRGNSSDVTFSTRSQAVAVQPHAIASVSGVRIEWTTPTVNTGCDGQTISEYMIRYHPVGSSDTNEIPVQNIQLNMIENIVDTVSLTQYEYTVVAIDPNGSNVSSDIKYFTTRNYYPPPPSLLSAEPNFNSITVTWELPIDASLYKITNFIIKVIAESPASNPIFYSFAKNGTSFEDEDIIYSGALTNLMSDSLYMIQIASQSAIGNGSFNTDHLLEYTTSFIPVAPANLSYAIVSNYTLMVSWNYPPSLIEQIISYEVTYSLVSAYNTSAGMKSFAEYDEFNTTQTSFHFALVSSVTNYIFTVTPYSATHAGDSARVLVDDFSEADLIEDPVTFFNLRFTSRTVNSLSSSEAKKINSDLTTHMQSSINDACRCTLPSYTLRGSIDSCDHSQSNCAIYTGRLLGSDTASATKVLEMVEEWLTAQNWSLLNGTLSVDPDCPLQLLSPSDTACSSPSISYNDTTVENNSSTEENETGSDGLTTDGIKMLGIGFASGFGIIICLVSTCACLFKVCKMKKKKPNVLTYSESEARLTPFLQTDADAQRHYSVVVDRNPSYNRHHKNAIKPFYTPNGRASSTGSLCSESPYSYTSLKTAQRQANAVPFEQQEDDAIPHEPVEQLQIHASESSTNQCVVESLSSSDYFNEGHAPTFHPSSTSSSQGSYLSIS